MIDYIDFQVLLSLISVSPQFLPPLAVAPNVTSISAKQTVISPTPVSFNCTVDSYPPSTITWLHNGDEVQAAPPRVTISTVQVDNRTQESTLTILNTTAEDAGTYTCSAESDAGSTNLSTGLQVFGELILFQLLSCVYFISAVHLRPIFFPCSCT